MLFPISGSFVIAFKTFRLVSFEHGGIQSVLVKLKYVYKILPSPVDCLFLEVVTKRPVAEHFKHSVVVCVVTYLFKVVMFAGYTQAFLTVGDAFVGCRTVAENDVFELVHTGICKH